MTASEPRLIGADILRGIAILAVLAYHGFGPSFGYFPPWNGWYRNFRAIPDSILVISYPLSLGWAGVALFFVLSGFCIHLSFLRSSQFSLAQFLWQRFWRIYPCYALALVAFCFLEGISVVSTGGIHQLISHAFLFHNFRYFSFFGVNPSFWSIATEVQLYILFPFLLLLRQYVGIRGCLLLTFAIGVASRIVSVTIWGLPDHLITPALSSPATTWFDWTLGAYVAECLAHGKMAFSRHSLWLVALSSAFLLSTLYKPLTLFSFSLAAALSAIILDLIARGRFEGCFSSGLALVGVLRACMESGALDEFGRLTCGNYQTISE